MMKKTIITIINIISVIPILIYPLAFIAGIMSFDAGPSMVAWLIFLISTTYPIFIIACIIFSRKINSLSLSFIALLPLLALLYIFFIAGGTAQKDNYNTLSKDFICNSNSFLSVEKNGNFGSINILEKKNFLNYENETIATIDNNATISLMSANPKEAKDLLSNCKNNEGKSMLDFYTLISD